MTAPDWAVASVLLQQLACRMGLFGRSHGCLRLVTSLMGCWQRVQRYGWGLPSSRVQNSGREPLNRVWKRSTSSACVLAGIP